MSLDTKYTETSLKIFLEIFSKSNNPEEFERNIVELSQRLFLQTLEKTLSAPKAVLVVATFAMEMKDIFYMLSTMVKEKEAENVPRT